MRKVALAACSILVLVASLTAAEAQPRYGYPGGYAYPPYAYGPAYGYGPYYPRRVYSAPVYGPPPYCGPGPVCAVDPYAARTSQSAAATEPCMCLDEAASSLEVRSIRRMSAATVRRRG